MNFELHKARKEAGLTQQEVADKVGIKRTSYTRIELGRMPDIELAYKIALAVNKTVDDVFLPKIVHNLHNGTEQ